MYVHKKGFDMLLDFKRIFKIQFIIKSGIVKPKEFQTYKIRLPQCNIPIILETNLKNQFKFSKLKSHNRKY